MHNFGRFGEVPSSQKFRSKNFLLKNDIFFILLEMPQKCFQIILELRKHVLGTQKTLETPSGQDKSSVLGDPKRLR